MVEYKQITNDEFCELLRNLKVRLDSYSSMAYKIEDEVEKEISKSSIAEKLYFIIKTEGGEILIVRNSDQIFFVYSGLSPIINSFIKSFEHA